MALIRFSFYSPPPPPPHKNLKKSSPRTTRRTAGVTALSVLLTLTALLSLSATVAAQSATDYDSDNDGYIDVKTHQQLNAIRYDLDGNGAQDSVSASDWTNYTSAFSNAATGMGCKLTDHDSNSQTADQPTCVGYELMNDIDLDTDGDGNIGTDSGDAYYNSGDGWAPLGSGPGAAAFSGDFKGNGFTIDNLFINRTTGSANNYIGLFGYTTSSPRIETLGVTNANVTGNNYVAILVGVNQAVIVACYTTGKAQGNDYVGGLLGYTSGDVLATYSTAYVSGRSRVGGLVANFANDRVRNSYSTGRVARSGGTATTIGGLIGTASASGTATNSYWDTSTSGQSTSAGGSGVTGKTTRQLQTPTGYSGIYANWNTNLDGVTGNDDPWTFGNKMQYPMLHYKGMSTDPQGGQAMGIADNWNAPIVGERVGVCLANPSNRATGGSGGKKAWIWEKSTNGDTWTPISRSVLPSFEYTPTTNDVGSYLRAKVQLSGGGFAYTRALGGRVKQTSAATAGAAISFVSGNTSPQVGTQIVASDPRPTGAVDAHFSWQRCPNTTTPHTDCVYIPHVWWSNYTPVAADLNQYLRMVVYYETSAGVWTRHASAFTGQVAVASQ